MRGSTWNATLATMLLAAFPLFVACDAGDEEGQPGAGQPGQQQPQGQQPPGQQPAPGQGQAMDLSEDELDTFADVYMELDEVRVETETRLQEAEGQQEQSQVQQDANAQMEQILNDHDMTVQEYQRIAQVINLDPEQRQEFEEILEEKGGSLPQPQQQPQQP